MSTDYRQIRVVVLTHASCDLANHIHDVVKDAGWSCQIVPRSAFNPSRNYSSLDIVIVDSRNGDSIDWEIPDKYPVLALVNADQSEESLAAITRVDDFVTPSEVGNGLFFYKITALVNRYANPLSLRRNNIPEFDLIKSLVNTISDQIYIKDTNHRFLFVSDLFAESNGLALSDVIGKDDLEIGSSDVDVRGSPELGLGFWQKDDEAVDTGITTIEENPDWRALLEDTRQRRVFRVPLKNNRGEVYALIVCSSDATDAQFSAVDVKARGAMLDRVLGEMQKAQESQQVAEHAEMAKNKLLAAASHDLRQPLHAMGLFLDVLERRVNGDQEQELIAKIKRSSDALSVLFNSMLDISRLDAGVVDVDQQHFLIEDLLSSLRAEFREIGMQKLLEIEIPACNRAVYTDPILLERVLRNLIQNAVTYTSDGSVVVNCEVQESTLLLSVTDTGPGIPPEEQGVIFSEYYQMEGGMQGHSKGLGLGLAIVSRLAELLHIELDLKSEVGKGSTFSVTLPRGEMKNIPDSYDSEDALALNGMVIAIIDDEIDICEGMANMLCHYDCVPVTAETAKDALAIMIERDIVPNVIVADFRLKHDQTGEQAIAEIREEFSSDIPAVIVTGDTSADRLRDATRSGCQLLHKPVQPSQLVRAIAELS